ncbi:MAG: GTP 3',8-cyclase MoaA [Syntrophales bacterium]
MQSNDDISNTSCTVTGFVLNSLSRMIDQFNREINYLRVSITDRCNLRCRYCMPKEGVSVLGHEDILRYEEILRIVEAGVRLGIVKVRITGGEPLVRRGVVHFFSMLKTLDGLRDITLTTNGILLEEFAESLYDAGVKRINISLDSLNPEKYALITRGGNLNRVLRGIEKASRLGFSPIKINVVAIKDFNEDEILDFAGLARKGTCQVRFIELMHVGNAADHNQLNYISNLVIMERISRVYPLIPVSDRSRMDGPARIYRMEDAAGEIGFIDSGDQHLCKSCNRLRLTADGHLRACLLVDDEMDIKTPLRSGCNDSELESLISLAIMRKPDSHNCLRQSRHIKKCIKEMHSIGG